MSEATGVNGVNSARLGKALCLVVCSALLACGDPLVAPELITHPRVLAARTEAAGDASRAWVMPSEAASVRWLVAGPDGAVLLGWGFSACVAESTSRGLPICVAMPLAQLTSTDPSTNEPRFGFTLPDAAGLGTATQIAVNGVFCTSGTPTLAASGVDFTTPRCPDSAEKPMFATVNVQVALDGNTNANPDFGRIPIQLDGVDWPAWSDEQATPAGCADQSLPVPRVAAGGASHELELAVPVDMSEPLPQVSSHSAARETLNLAHFVTAGDLERAYSDVNLATDPARVHVIWKTPPTVSAGGQLVRFYFVLHDGRDGADYTERAVCVTP